MGHMEKRPSNRQGWWGGVEGGRGAAKGDLLVKAVLRCLGDELAVPHDLGQTPQGLTGRAA